MTITETLRKLLDKGAAPDVILVAIEGAEQLLLARVEAAESALRNVMSRDKELDQIRESGRLRQQKLRERKAAVTSRNVTSRDDRSAALVPQVKNLTSFKKDSKILNNGESLFGEGVQREVANVSRDKRGSRLPDDWMPEDPDFADEILGKVRAAVELAKFRDYWKAQPGSKGVKLDWQATWRNWVRKAPEFAPRQQQPGKSQLMQAFDRLEERMNREEESDPELRESNLLRLPLGSVRGP